MPTSVPAVPKGERFTPETWAIWMAAHMMPERDFKRAMRAKEKFEKRSDFKGKKRRARTRKRLSFEAGWILENRRLEAHRLANRTKDWRACPGEVRVSDVWAGIQAQWKIWAAEKSRRPWDSDPIP